MRFGGVAGVAADANRRKPTDSKNGSANTAVLERRKWRRVIMVLKNAIADYFERNASLATNV